MNLSGSGDLFPPVPTVSQVTQKLGQELSEGYRNIILQGEISNFRKAPSGHLYFVLKDATAQLRAVMFKGQTWGLKFMPQDGLQVEATGDITLYEPRGDLQIILKQLRPAGLGALMEAFHKLKESLEQEGLFNPLHKKLLPEFPQTIVLITSPTGAALRDMVHVARRRWPGINLVLVPSLVQGEEAGESLVRAIQLANRWGEGDVIIIGRGGGSLEDLWAFNEERVVRAIAESHTPIVSAVGHETDTTLSDFAADHRAATPSAAAELVVPQKHHLVDSLTRTKDQLLRRVTRLLENRREHVQRLINAYGLKRPELFLQKEQIHLDQLQDRLGRATTQKLGSNRKHLESLSRTLGTLDPSQVLGRGYAWVRTPAGRTAQSAQDLPSEAILQFSEDRARVRVIERVSSGPFDPLEPSS